MHATFVESKCSRLATCYGADRKTLLCKSVNSKVMKTDFSLTSATAHEQEATASAPRSTNSLDMWVPFIFHRRHCLSSAPARLGQDPRMSETVQGDGRY